MSKEIFVGTVTAVGSVGGAIGGGVKGWDIFHAIAETVPAQEAHIFYEVFGTWLGVGFGGVVGMIPGAILGAILIPQNKNQDREPSRYL